MKLFQYLCEDKKEYTLSKHLLISGTSAGAMVKEVEHAETKKDLLHKMAIAQKEINEAIYWFDLLKETNYLISQYYESIHLDAIEIIKIITSILKSTKSNIAVI